MIFFRFSRAQGFFLIGALLAQSEIVCAESIVASAASLQASSKPDRTACGSAIEQATWSLWDESGRAWASEQLLGKRLLEQGDVYALYDLEITLHNLLAMAVRCQRAERLSEFAMSWGIAYRQLEEVPSSVSMKIDSQATFSSDKASPASRGWICRGGTSCNGNNKLRGTEVMLVSVQGLALFAQLASALVTSTTASNKRFVDDTAQLLSAHLERASDKEKISNWLDATNKKASDITDGSSKYFFKDQDLWMLGLYAELAGILAKRSDLRSSVLQEKNQFEHHKQVIKTLLRFFKSRVALDNVNSTWTGKAVTAELDRGYWRLYSDNRYAGYTGSQKPAICGSKRSETARELRVSLSDVAPVPTLGWDLSHARRLVPVLDSLERNRDALSKIFELSDNDLPDPKLGKFFAAQLLVRVWNGNVTNPLFSNYLSGSNGWYRVAYNNGMDRCIEGYPPFGLSDSFPTGGYAVWAKYYPIFSRIALSILDSTNSSQSAAASDAKGNYGALMSQGSPNSRLTNRLMFWPSLVGVD